MRTGRVVRIVLVVVAFAAAGCSGRGGPAVTSGGPPGTAVATPSPTQASPKPGKHGGKTPRPTHAPPSPTGNPFSPKADLSPDANGQGTPAGHTSPSPAALSSTEDDRKTFAYATTDEASLATQTAAMADTVGSLSADAAAHDVDAAQADAQTLLDQATEVGADAGTATGRLQPLDPSDPTLQSAQGDGVAAFALTEQYATTATDLANAALELDLRELAQVVQQAAALAGTSDDLTAAYDHLTQELAAWSQANPVDAARALSTYGG
jgi:hypothetical protein